MTTLAIVGATAPQPMQNNPGTELGWFGFVLAGIAAITVLYLVLVKLVKRQSR